MDNYNIIIAILVLLFIYWFKKTKGKDNKTNLFLYTWITVFIILIAVFLFTDNYKFVIDQTTVNRVFTTTFLLILWFSGFLLQEE